MTATQLLDQLDAAHAAGTPGPWFAWDRGVGWLITLDTDGGSNPLPEGSRTDLGREEDAELIIAAVNTLPRLTTALRGVLHLADQLEADTTGYGPTTRKHIAARIRATITDALRIELAAPQSGPRP